MTGLHIRNEQVSVRLSRDARLSFRLAADELDRGNLPLSEGSAEAPGVGPVTGLLHYAVPCVFEHLSVRLEGIAVPLMDRTAGDWPASVVEDELDTYPYLHFLEERKTGTPWRLERWYTLAGPYLVFDSQQYFERSRPAQRGRDWERLIVHLRQTMDMTRIAQGTMDESPNLVQSAAS